MGRKVERCYDEAFEEICESLLGSMGEVNELHLRAIDSDDVLRNRF